MFENLEAVGESAWASRLQASLVWVLGEFVLPLKLRRGVTSFAPRPRVDVDRDRVGLEPMDLWHGEPEVVLEEVPKLLQPQTNRSQLELPFEWEPAPAEEVQRDLWPEHLGTRTLFTAVNKISTGCGPSVDERHWLGIVASPAFEEARHRAQCLERYALSATQTAFHRALVDASVGHRQKILWGEESCMDALRLRFIGHLDWKLPGERRSVDDVVWLGALEWLGGRLATGADVSKAPRKARRVLATSVAASDGYRKSLALLRSWPQKDRRFSWVSLIALRSVFEGWMVRDVVSSLIPSREDEARRLRNDSPWVPLALALRWAVTHGHQAGVVFALSAILATAFRRSLENAGDMTLEPWGCGVFPEEQMRMCFDRLGSLCAKGWSPWKEPSLRAAGEGADLDLSELASILQRVMGDLDLLHLGLLCLSEHLLHASLFTLLGNLPSAQVHLALSPRPPWTRGLRVALAIDEGEPTLQDLLERSPLGSERTKVYAALEATPDPSVALATPVWSLSDHLGDVASVFMRARKGPALRSVRSLLQREDLKKTIRPYWLLSGRDKGGLVAAMKWAGGLEPYPKEEAWWEFLESQARQVLEESPWTH